MKLSSIKWFTILLFLSILSFISCRESERNVTVQLFLKNVIEKNENFHLKWIEVKSNQESFDVELMDTTTEVWTDNLKVIFDDGKSEPILGKSEAIQGNIKTYQGEQNVDDNNNTLSVEISLFDKQIRGAVTLGEDTFDIVPSDITSGDQEVALKVHIAGPSGKCKEVMNPNHQHSEADGIIDGSGKDIGHEILENLHISKREAKFHIHNWEEENHFIELYVVADNHFYKAMGSSTSEAMKFVVETVNHVNAYYRKFHIHINLVGIEIWVRYNLITSSADSSKVLSAFSYYQRTRIKTKHDVAHLMTNKVFADKVAGIAYVGGMCSFFLSSGLTTIYENKNPLTSGTIFAHELGHNLNLRHDDDHCQCQPHSKCLMHPILTKNVAGKWSDCSINSLKSSMQYPMSFCMKNRPYFINPDSLADCGNGVIDRGEECDPGERATSSKCCNPTTCKLQQNAQCASGACCDQSTCQLRPTGTLCSHKNSESNVCDFPEYCDGKSEFCPPDTYPADGSKQCTNEGDYCYKKRCGSRTELCQKFYGSVATDGPDLCYSQNKKGSSAYGYCSYSLVGNTENSATYRFSPCSERDHKCGVIHCHKYSSSFPTFWNASIDKRLSISNNGGYCFHPLFDMRLSGLNDPGISPNGANCGSCKICMNSECKHLGQVQKNCDCKNGGECNNLGRCHCPAGFRGPKCEERCFRCCGGSDDANYCIGGTNKRPLEFRSDHCDCPDKGQKSSYNYNNDLKCGDHISGCPNVFMNKTYKILGRLLLTYFFIYLANN